MTGEKTRLLPAARGKQKDNTNVPYYLYSRLIQVLFMKHEKNYTNGTVTEYRIKKVQNLPKIAKTVAHQALRLEVMQGIYEKRSKLYKWYGARVSQYITQQYVKSAYGTSDLVACQVSTARRMGRW